MYHRPGPVKDIIVGKKSIPYWESSECDICQAIDNDGKSLRLKIDRFSITHEIKETLEYLKEFGIDVTKAYLTKHTSKHSRYLEDAKKAVLEQATKAALSRVDTLADEFIEADEVIQDIINIGGKKIKAGEMNVGEKLVIAALKEQGARKKMGSLQQMFKDLDKGRFVEGEVVEEKEELPPILSETDAQKQPTGDLQS